MASDVAPAELARGLAEALASRGAHVVKSWQEGARSYLFADSLDGSLFGRSSRDPGDVAVFEHEAAVRAVVGTDGPLRSPPVLDKGAGWLLERGVDPQPLAGASAVDSVVAAASRIADLRLPESPAGEPVRSAFARRLRALASPLPLSDYLAARRVLGEVDLPVITAHGDFHVDNVLLSEETAWVVDWELSGIEPAGYDLMTLWPTLADAADRERLFEAAVDLVGSPHRQGLLRLRYAGLVRAIAAKLASRREFDRDPAGARALLELLPSVRAEARIR